MKTPPGSPRSTPPLIVHIHRPGQQEEAPAPSEEMAAHESTVSFHVFPSNHAASPEQRQPLLSLGEWFPLGHTDYEGTSRSVTDIGQGNLDVVASFMSEADLRNFAAAGFGAGPLTLRVIETLGQIDDAQSERSAAQDQIAAAERNLGRFLSTCRGDRASWLVAATLVASGSLVLLVASGGSGEVPALTLGGTCFTGSGVAFLYVGTRLIRAACQQRRAGQALTDGQHALTAARNVEASARENLSALMNRLQGVDMPKPT